MILAIAHLASPSDKSYIDYLYRVNYKMLHKLTLSIVKKDDDAEDTVTNAMLSLFSLIPKLRAMKERERVAYLRATVRNAYKYYKASKRRSVTELPLDHDLLFSLPSKECAPDEALIRDEEFRMVWEAIANLSEKDRRVLHLRYAADLTSEEIAELTGASSAAAVRERLSRARCKVLTKLEERGWADGGEQEHPGLAGAVGGQAVPTDH